MNKITTHFCSLGIAAIAAVVLDTTAIEAQPGLIASNDSTLPGTDGNNITIDTDTLLEWLDPSATVNLSFDQVSQLLLTDADYSGFRYATRAELEVFFAHLGLPTGNMPNISSFSDGGAAYLEAVQFIGTTGSPANWNTTRGLLADSYNSTQQFYGSALIGVNFTNALTAANSAKENFSQSGDIGSWLIREASVPNN